MRELSEIKFGDSTFEDAVRLHRIWLRDEVGGKRLVVPVRFNLSGSDLRGANLRGADLSDLRSAFSCAGNMEEIRSMQIEHYVVAYDAVYLQIGCQRHKIVDARNFGDAEARKFDGERAVEWWAKWKETIFKIINMAPATPGKTEA